MPKAFTEEQKVQIRQQIIEAMIELFHDQNFKATTIHALTQRAGIAQGTFYKFWKDKESLILDVLEYRANQKLEELTEKLPGSLQDPVGFLYDILWEYCISIHSKIKSEPNYREIFLVNPSDFEKAKKLESIYLKYLSKLESYWREHNAVKYMDSLGLTSAILGSLALSMNNYHIDESYFLELLEIYIRGTLEQYLAV